MKPIKVFKDEDQPGEICWREVNPYPECEGGLEKQSHKWFDFEVKIKHFAFPNAPTTKSGEVVEAYLQWQYWDIDPRRWRNTLVPGYWQDHNAKTRQILVLASPKESKETDKEEQLTKAVIKASLPLHNGFEQFIFNDKPDKPLGWDESIAWAQANYCDIRPEFDNTKVRKREKAISAWSFQAGFQMALKQSPSAPKVESSEDDNRLEILNRCSPDFYPVKDDNGHLYPAYGHDNVLEAMKQYAAPFQSQLEEKQRECERLRKVLKEISDLHFGHIAGQMAFEALNKNI